MAPGLSPGHFLSRRNTPNNGLVRLCAASSVSVRGNERKNGGKPLVLVVVATVHYEAEQPADDAYDQRAEHGRDEAVDVERHAQLVGHPACEPEQQAVDDDADQPEGSNVRQAADGLGNRLQHRVNDAEDERDHDNGRDLAGRGVGLHVNAGDERRGHPDGQRRYHELDQNPHHAIMSANRSGAEQSQYRSETGGPDYRGKPSEADRGRRLATAQCDFCWTRRSSDGSIVRGKPGDTWIGPQGRGRGVAPQRGWGSGDLTMFGWLMPDAAHQALFEGWDRQHYRPRHGRPPLVVRGAYSAANVIGRARERYLGAGEEENLAGAPGRHPQRADLYSLNTPRRSWRPAGRRSVQYVRPRLACRQASLGPCASPSRPHLRTPPGTSCLRCGGRPTRSRYSSPAGPPTTSTRCTMPTPLARVWRAGPRSRRSPRRPGGCGWARSSPAFITAIRRSWP